MYISKKDYFAICDRAEELKNENELLKSRLRIAENNELLLLKENSILKNTIKQVNSLSESNTYSNADLRIRKIKELVKTAIHTNSKIDKKFY